MLLEPTEKFSNFVFKSANYLNSPKFIFNYWLDCFYRQFCEQGREVTEIADFLKKCGFENPVKSAKSFVAWRKTISLKEFEGLNVNSYIDNEPTAVTLKSKEIENWYKSNIKETWRHGVLILTSQLSYPFQTDFK